MQKKLLGVAASNWGQRGNTRGAPASHRMRRDLRGEFITAKSHLALARNRLRLDMLRGICHSTVHRAAAPARSFRLDGPAKARDDVAVL